MNRRSAWYPSIVLRLTFVLTLFVVLASLLSGWLVYRGSREQVVGAKRSDMRHTLALAHQRLEGFVRTMDEDIGFLADNETVARWAAVCDQGDSTAIRDANDRVALLMESFITSRADYAQVRLLAADNAGMEQVRFDRDRGVIKRTPDKLLQAKADRDYYKASIGLEQGQHYFSAIDLNKENGRLSQPLMPTLRAAATIRSPSGAVVGMVVINADLRPLFAELLRLSPTDGALMMADEHGELLLHPDTSLTFRFEFGASSRLPVGPGDTAVANVPPWPGRLRDLVELDVIDVLGPQRPYVLALRMDSELLLAGIRRERDRSLVITGAVAAGFVLLSVAFARRMAARLARLTKRVERYAEGNALEPLPVERRDEIGRLSRTLELMQSRIDDRVAEAEQARGRAEQADRVRRDLVTNMSHEVRTPLTAIIGMAEGIDASVLRVDEQERFAVLRRSALRLRALVDDVLLHARLEEGVLELRPEAVDVRQLVDDLVRSHGALAQAKGVLLEAHTRTLPPSCWTDPLRLHQIIDNLLGNAVNYTQEGRIDLVVETTGDDGLRIEVADTGPGLTPEEQQRVFKRFERASSGENERSGTGLGLAIAKRLVDLMGGELLLWSEKGRGSRFEVRLPLSSSHTANERPVGIDPALVNGLRVLHVDDVSSNRMVVQQWAQRWNWSLDSVASGDEAIDRCRANDHDMVLLDMHLGEHLKGTDLGARLREIDGHRYVPMLLVTAFADEEHEVAALLSGANDRIVKPIHAQELLEKAAFWCGRWRGVLGHVVSTGALEEQFDNNPATCIRALGQYRQEFVQWRLDLRNALVTGDVEGLAAVRHKLKPHWQLLGLAEATSLLDRLDASTPDPVVRARIEEVFRLCDRDLLARQRALSASLRST